MKNRVGSIPLGLLAGWLAGIGTLLVLSAALAQLILSESLPENTVTVGAMVVLGLSTAIDAIVSALVAKHRWLPVCLGAGGLLFASMVGIGLAMGGSIRGVGGGFLVAMGASIAVGMIALKGERGMAKKGQFRRYGKLVQNNARGK